MNARIDPHARENTTTVLYLPPKWWQFVRRFREWREYRALIGMKVMVNGVERTIVDYSKGVTTVEYRWGYPPSDADFYDPTEVK